MKKVFSLGVVSVVSVMSLMACSNSQAKTVEKIKEVEVIKTMEIVESASVESVSASSTNAFYAESSFIGEDLVRLFTERLGAISIATTNADGAPNLATAVPSMTEDGQYLFLSLAPCQTLTNLKERKMAVVESYIYNKEAEDKLERNQGARVAVTLEEDEVKIKELKQDLIEKEIIKADYADNYLFLKVEKVLPLG